MLPSQPCVTAELKLAAAEPDDTGEAPLHPELALTRTAVLRAVRHESARRLDDVLSRRSRSLLLDARAALALAPTVADIMAGELGWDIRRRTRELSDFIALAQAYLPPDQAK